MDELILYLLRLSKRRLWSKRLQFHSATLSHQAPYFSGNWWKVRMPFVPISLEELKVRNTRFLRMPWRNAASIVAKSAGILQVNDDTRYIATITTSAY